MEKYLYYDLKHPKRVGPFLERWKNVIGYKKHYMISDYGRCLSLSRKTKNNLNTQLILKMSIDGLGYVRYGFCKNGVIKCRHSHRLVALHFIPNPQTKKHVNHLDGIKSNPFIGNLEWSTESENRFHAYRTGLHIPYQSKLILDTSTGIFFDSVKQAEKQMGMYRGELTQMILGRKTNTTNLIQA